eukprot:6184677-Pleurochrysis_carterae.AAC.1
MLGRARTFDNRLASVACDHWDLCTSLSMQIDFAMYTKLYTISILFAWSLVGVQQALAFSEDSDFQITSRLFRTVQYVSTSVQRPDSDYRQVRIEVLLLRCIARIIPVMPELNACFVNSHVLNINYHPRVETRARWQTHPPHQNTSFKNAKWSKSVRCASQRPAIATWVAVDLDYIMSRAQAHPGYQALTRCSSACSEADR